MSKLKSRTNQPVSSDDKLLEQVSFNGTKVIVKKPVEVVGSIKSTGLEVDNVISSSNKLSLADVLISYDNAVIDNVVARFVSDGATYLIINLEISILTTSATNIEILSLPALLMPSFQSYSPLYFPATNSLGGAGKVTIPDIDGEDNIVVNVDAGAVRTIYTTIILSKIVKEV